MMQAGAGGASWLVLVLGQRGYGHGCFRMAGLCRASSCLRELHSGTGQPEQPAHTMRGHKHTQPTARLTWSKEVWGAGCCSGNRKDARVYLAGGRGEGQKDALVVSVPGRHPTSLDQSQAGSSSSSGSSGSSGSSSGSSPQQLVRSST